MIPSQNLNGQYGRKNNERINMGRSNSYSDNSHDAW